MTDGQRHLTTQEVADRLGVSVRTLQRLLRRHAIRRDGTTGGQIRHNLYSAATVDYLRQQVADGTDGQPETTTDSQDDTPDDLTRTDSHGATALLALVAEMAAMRAERDRLRHEHDELLARALAAEWEAARLRPLTVLPDPPAPAKRRWWRR
jgi:excisionase family DNA binding protein